MSQHPPIQIGPLGFPWPTLDPFLFCVHHDDAYPAGNGRFGPAASLAGRQLGQDFAGLDGWRMYHGLQVPGFPSHPHRGFETVTIVRRGLIDHADSLGAAARFGSGDVQWLTAGAGIQHAEMFPLLDTVGPNPLELFQIWLNLPARSKMAPPHFTMFWAEDIPRHRVFDGQGRAAEIVVIAGALPGAEAGAPLPLPPDSFAAQPDSALAIWTLKLDAGARLVLPPAPGAGARRRLYFFKGRSIAIAGRQLREPASIDVPADSPVELVAGEETVELLMLQGRPIGEPVAQYGPFVMNTRQQLQQAFEDYQRTQFGGWPWPDSAPVHGAEPRRFARHVDGRLEERPLPKAAAAER